MTLVSNDPSWWPSINSYRVSSYFVVAASAGVMYDWALTFGQEVELVWRQHWSLMTALYLGVRYLGISFAVVHILYSVPTIPMTDAVRVRFLTIFLVQYNDCHSCLMPFYAQDWIDIVVNAILGVIMIARLHAMYQRSRKVLILLVVVFLAANISGGVVAAIFMTDTSGEAFILSGTYECTMGVQEDPILLNSMTWILGTVWEVLALFLAVWIAVKHFRELRHSSAGGIIGDCFTVLMKTHILYFASFVTVSCFNLGYFFSKTISADAYSIETQIYVGLLAIFQLVQICVLGPRLILGVREYHAKLVTHSDAATGMTSIAFQERVHVSTSGSV